MGKGCSKDWTVPGRRGRHSAGAQLMSGSFSCRCPHLASRTAHGAMKIRPLKGPRERAVLWSQASNRIHTFCTTAYFLNSALKWAIILCFTPLRIIPNNSLSTFPFGKIKGWHGYLLNSSCSRSFSSVQKVSLILKGLIDKTQRNSREKDKEKEEERERRKRPEKKEKEEGPRGAERG